MSEHNQDSGSEPNELPDDQFQEEWLTAYIDGELNPEQRQEVERRLQFDSNAQLLLLDLQKIKGVVAELPRLGKSSEERASFTKDNARFSLQSISSLADSLEEDSDLDPQSATIDNPESVVPVADDSEAAIQRELEEHLDELTESEIDSEAEIKPVVDSEAESDAEAAQANESQEDATRESSVEGLQEFSIAPREEEGTEASVPIDEQTGDRAYKAIAEETASGAPRNTDPTYDDEESEALTASETAQVSAVAEGNTELEEIASDEESTPVSGLPSKSDEDYDIVSEASVLSAADDTVEFLSEAPPEDDFETVVAARQELPKRKLAWLRPATLALSVLLMGGLGYLALTSFAPLASNRLALGPNSPTDSVSNTEPSGGQLESAAQSPMPARGSASNPSTSNSNTANSGTADASALMNEKSRPSILGELADASDATFDSLLPPSAKASRVDTSKSQVASEAVEDNIEMTAPASELPGTLTPPTLADNSLAEEISSQAAIASNSLPLPEFPPEMSRDSTNGLADSNQTNGAGAGLAMPESRQLPPPTAESPSVDDIAMQRNRSVQPPVLELPSADDVVLPKTTLPEITLSSPNAASDSRVESTQPENLAPATEPATPRPSMPSFPADETEASSLRFEASPGTEGIAVLPGLDREAPNIVAGPSQVPGSAAPETNPLRNNSRTRQPEASRSMPQQSDAAVPRRSKTAEPPGEPKKLVAPAAELPGDRFLVFASSDWQDQELRNAVAAASSTLGLPLSSPSDKFERSNKTPTLALTRITESTAQQVAPAIRGLRLRSCQAEEFGIATLAARPNASTTQSLLLFTTKSDAERLLASLPAKFGSGARTQRGRSVLWLEANGAASNPKVLLLLNVGR
ncbi:MAG: hypothetical protein AB8B50_17795 [Pirellulaceae bacterium]